MDRRSFIKKAGLATGAAATTTLAEFNANNTQALETLLNKHGVELHEFSDELYKAFGSAAKDVLATAGASDPLTQKVYESFLAFRQKALRWSDLSDRSYMNKRALTPFS